MSQAHADLITLREEIRNTIECVKEGHKVVIRTLDGTDTVGYARVLGEATVVVETGYQDTGDATYITEVCIPLTAIAFVTVMRDVARRTS